MLAAREPLARRSPAAPAACMASADALVEVALGAAELDPLDDLGLRRQVRRHLLLGPAQHERPHAARQHARRSASPCFSIGVRNALRNGRGVAEQARHQEVEQRPQLAQVVLERRAGQAEAVPGARAGSAACVISASGS